MFLRNLMIRDDIDLPSKEEIIDGINELALIIDDNYDETLKKEIALEFNIGSRLGIQKDYLVVYANPAYANNPYVFILSPDKDGTRRLHKETDLGVFKELSDLFARQDINKAISTGFARLPQYAFLSQQQICDARQLAMDYDYGGR